MFLRTAGYDIEVGLYHVDCYAEAYRLSIPEWYQRFIHHCLREEEARLTPRTLQDALRDWWEAETDAPR